jgi:hypothetical protein
MKNLLAMKYKILLLISALTISSLASGQITEMKTLRKSFKVIQDPVINVTNKYGKIHISQSKTDSISIRVEIEAKSENQSRVRSLLTGVDVNFTLNGQTVMAETALGKTLDDFFESFKGLTKDLINYNTSLSIDYYIECPLGTVMKLTNSYGDVYIENRVKELTLNISNGSLDAGVIDYSPLMTLFFCNAEIKSLVNGKISASYSELKAEEITDVSLVTRSTKVKIGNAGKIEIDSRRDDYIISLLKTISGTTNFSDIDISKITGETSLYTKYGNLSIDKIPEEFKIVDINSAYTDIDLNFERNTSFTMEVRHTNASVITSGIKPQPLQTEISAENKVYLTTCKTGKSPDKGKVMIDATHGEVKLTQED